MNNGGRDCERRKDCVDKESQCGEFMTLYRWKLNPRIGYELIYRLQMEGSLLVYA